MIKFFRKIRQRLVTENKFSKYLLYAIGEIILVVIGILIALSINNWNQERTIIEKSDELLRGMCKDLSQDITTLDRMIFHYEDRLDFYERYIHLTDFSSIPLDTLFKICDGSAGSFNINPQSFEKAKNLGISQICYDDSLSDRIDNYYSRLLDFNKTIVKYDQDETVKDIDFWMNQLEGIEIGFPVNMNFPIIQDSLEGKKNILTAITSPQGRNHIRMECIRKDLVLNKHKEILETAEELKADIKEYLNH